MTADRRTHSPIQVSVSPTHSVVTCSRAHVLTLSRYHVATVPSIPSLMGTLFGPRLRELVDGILAGLNTLTDGTLFGR
jgi:hypothetical protein